MFDVNIGFIQMQTFALIETGELLECLRLRGRQKKTGICRFHGVRSEMLVSVASLKSTTEIFLNIIIDFF